MAEPLTHNEVVARAFVVELRERVRVLEEANDRLRRFVADEDDRHVSAGGIHADPDL